MTEMEFEAEVDAFLTEWRNDRPTVEVQTSGSTGAPKRMQVEKERMRASARATCDFLGLHPADTALLCMSVHYIAGKMMVVRALERGLRLTVTPPSGHPLQAFIHCEESFDFVAMTPMQVYNSLLVKEETEALRRVRHLLIGGGAIDADLARALCDHPHAVWSSYGMTETLSHIALRRVNGPQASEWYTPMPGVTISLDKTDDTLLIHAPRVCAETLHTHDIAGMNALGQFRILGRTDNVINSGGVKIQIEEVEERLRPHLQAPYQITSCPDGKFGEVVVLLTEDNNPETVAAVCKAMLPPYWIPKHIRSVTAVPLTATGKPDRAAAKRMAAGE